MTWGASADRVKQALALQLLPHHPLGRGLLAVPGLQQLLGEPLQGQGVLGLVNGAAHALQLKLLAKAEAEGLGHDASGSTQRFNAKNCFEPLAVGRGRVSRPLPQLLDTVGHALAIVE